MEESLHSYEGFYLGLVMILGCLVLSAFFSSTETALTSLSSLKTKHLRDKSKAARVLSLWLEKPHRVLAAVLILNNMVNIFASVYLDQLVTVHFGASSVVLVTSVMTVAIVLFAEIIPKTLANSYAEKVAVPFMFVFQGFYWAIYPVTWLASGFARQFSRLFGVGTNPGTTPQITEEELEYLINMGEEEGVIQGEKHEMLSGIFELGDTIVREIMVPRPDMHALTEGTRIADAVKTFEETGYSRLPVYEDRLDNVVGVVHAKDVLYFLRKHQEEDENYWETTVAEIKRDTMFAPETKSVDELFQDMRKNRQQMAIVIDEYGGTSGIVTMEDIFEEIVGEIRDEYDNEEDAIRPAKTAGQFLVDSKIHIDDFCDFFDLDMNEIQIEDKSDDYDTLGGLIVHHFGEIPRVGDVVDIGGLKVEVTELSRRRVRRVLVTTPAATQPEAPADSVPSEAASATEPASATDQPQPESEAPVSR